MVCPILHKATITSDTVAAGVSATPVESSQPLIVERPRERPVHMQSTVKCSELTREGGRRQRARSMTSP